MFQPLLFLDPGAAAAGAGVVTITESDMSDSNNLSTYVATITASAGHVVVALVAREANAGNALDVVSVVIDGVTATVEKIAASGASDALLAVAHATITGGPTVTMTVTLSDVASELRWSTVVITDLASGVAHDVAQASGNAVSGAVALNIPAGGVAIAAGMWRYLAAGDNLTFAGLTEQWSNGRLGTQMGVAADDGMGAETARAITLNATEVADYKILGISWS